MMLYARIEAGRVVETIEIPDDGAPIAERFHPDIVAACVCAEAGIDIGWRYVRGEFMQPLPAAQDDLAAAARGERNARLAACDWTMLADAPPDHRAAWAAYRAALRAVPAQAGFPDVVHWPAAPGET